MSVLNQNDLETGRRTDESSGHANTDNNVGGSCMTTTADHLIGNSLF